MAVIAVMAIACVWPGPAAAAQSCASPIQATLGNTPVSTVPGAHVVLTGLCDVSTAGQDIIYNASWLRFTAPASGTFTASTCGAVTFDSRIGVFADCASPSSVIACNDDSPGCTITSGQPWASKVTFAAAAGEVRFIAVGGFAASTTGTGTLRISYEGTAGTTCSQAILAVDGVNGFDTAGAPGSLDLTGTCSPGPFGDDVVHRVAWFAWVATATGPAEVSTCGTAPFDTRIAVLASCAPSSAIACNDDWSGCPGYTGKVRFAATAGTRYLVAIGGFDDSSAGAGQFTIVPNAPPPPACGTATQGCCAASTAPFCSNASCCAAVCAADPFCCSVDGAWDATCVARAQAICNLCGVPCPADLDGNGTVSGSDLAILLGNWGNPGAGDLDGSGAVDGADLSQLLGAWGPCA